MQADGIVCFAGNDWWVHNPMTEKHWMRALARRGWTVLFINSIGVGMPSAESPRVMRRLLRKLRSMLRFLKKDEGVWVLTPVLLPLWSFAPARSFNVFLLTMQVRWAMKRSGMSAALFWAGIPTAALLLRHITHTASVYYVQDNYPAYYDAMHFTRIEEDHDTLLREADAVICASIGLYERIAAERSTVHYIPHGVHPAFLGAPLAPSTEAPALIRDIPHPIIGYWGSLEALQDLDLVYELASAHPEWSFVFIGRVMADVAAVAALPNVHYPGPVPLEEVPCYGVHFDVGFMSFVQTEWIRFSCPIKFREYLAMGLPVVAPPIIEVERAYGGEGRIASTAEAFAEQIRLALQSDTPAERMRRRALVAGETWEASAGRVASILSTMGGRR
ncbi:MAG: glycosyltransferase [Bacteroidia bacterium]|nr:glycosyltransferase [Bacteroidia bacterium]